MLEAILPETLPATFEELKIPFLAVTTDFYTQCPCVLEHGPLMPAIVASSALPGILRPVELDGKVLIDGGFVNPVPFDLVKSTPTSSPRSTSARGRAAEPGASCPR